MMSVAAGILLAGYTIAYWGMETLHGRSVGFADLLVPGRYQSAQSTPGQGTAAGTSTAATQGGARG